MKTLLFFTALTCSLFVYSQKGNYIIGANYSYSMYEDQQASYNVFSVSPGIEYNNGFSFNVGIGYVRARSLSYYTNVYRKIDGFQSSLTASKRLLKGGILSPLISVTVGSTINNHHLGCYANEGKVECSNEVFTEVPRIDKFRFFGKAKFMFDFQLSNLSLRFGPTYTFHEGRMIYDSKERSESLVLDGYGIEGAVVYSISPRKLKR